MWNPELIIAPIMLTISIVIYRVISVRIKNNIGAKCRIINRNHPGYLRKVYIVAKLNKDTYSVSLRQNGTLKYVLSENDFVYL